MTKVECVVETITMQFNGRRLAGTKVTCPRCGLTTRSTGVGSAPVKRCLYVLMEECPKNEFNIYTAKGFEDGEEGY